MDPSQQTLRVAGLPPKTSQSDLQHFFDERINRKHGRQVVECIGPVCDHSSRNTKRTTVSFSSHNTAQKAFELEETSRQFIAEKGGRETITLDHTFQDLTTLHASNNPSTGKPDIDIVALHGLQGHAWNSFTTSSTVNQNAGRTKETNWLRDIMPRLLEQNQQQQIYPRVMTYGYNADVWMTKSAAEIDVPVDNLLLYLETEREGDPERPLFFIGHSLGGIVIKQAIVKLADQAMIKISEEPSTSTKRYNFPVRGCLLFGVPNKGSDVADSASTILKLLATVFNVNRSMVTDLQSKSQKLANIAGEFRQIRDEKSIPVISFYEKQNYNSLLGLIVNKDSAVIEYPGCPIPFGVDRNHKEMARFSNADAHALEPAINFLAKIARSSLTALNRRQTSTPLPAPSVRGNTDGEDKFSVLSRFDTVFLVDDSPSMNGDRWELVSKILDYSTAVAALYDPDGIDVHFFNNIAKNQDNVKDPAVAVEIHQNIYLKGNTPIRDQLSRHLNGYLKKYRRRPEDDLNFKGYNLIVLTDGEPNPEREDPSDISDIEDAKVTKPAYRMIRKMIVDIAHELDSDRAEKTQIGIQFCQIGNDPAAHTFFKYLDDRLKGKHKLKRDMIDTLLCRSEDDLTEKFFEKLLIGAIDKTVDYDEIPTASTQAMNGRGRLHQPMSVVHTTGRTVDEGYSNWPNDEKHDGYSYEHRRSEPEASHMQAMRGSQLYGAPPPEQKPRFSPRLDSHGEPGGFALPRHSTDPQGVAELPFRQPSRSQTFGKSKGIFSGWRPKA